MSHIRQGLTIKLHGMSNCDQSKAIYHENHCLRDQKYRPELSLPIKEEVRSLLEGARISPGDNRLMVPTDISLG